MLDFPYSAPLAGGVTIGGRLFALDGVWGRVAGISGIIRGAIVASSIRERFWRLIFLAGLVGGAAIELAVMGEDLAPVSFRWPLAVYAIAGLLVGVGAGLANGWTSGHGVCGTARLSPRSLTANAIYLGVGTAVAMLITKLF
jgi:hypothetical protein